MLVRILFLFIYFINIMALQMTLLKFKVDYLNPKYIQYMNISMKKISRHSPYYINAEVYTLDVAGNNVTVSILGLEYISGRYIPTPFFLKYKLCDFCDEPLIGQMIFKTLPTNLRCPFPMGYIHVNNMTLDLDKFPFMPVFTWSNLRAQGRIDVNASMTSTGVTLFYAYGIGVVTQSLESKSIKIPMRKPQLINSQNLKHFTKDDLVQN